ncbi:hypothetical protein DL770_009501 [Monosporascus sp. CRB-9-2]|nr:hypothetical protein DL770_009501 [Monosporascus sp. CRB-9-2]
MGYIPELQDLAITMVGIFNPQAQGNLKLEDYPDKAEFVFRCAIAIRDVVMETTPLDHTYRAEVLGRYLDWTTPSYSKWGGEGNRVFGIELARRCLSELPPDDPERAHMWSLLGALLFQGRSPDSTEKEEAISGWRKALDQPNGSLKHRITAGRQLLRYFALIRDWESAYDAANQVVHLIPQMTPRVLWQDADRQYKVRSDGYFALDGLACEAATAALRAGKGPIIALELLEVGRGLLASSFEEIRADVIKLQAHSTKLAGSFDRLRDEINSPNTAAMRRHEASLEFEHVLGDIRKESGFEHFLAFPGEQAVKAAAKDGPIVVINVSRFGCDAILAKHDKIWPLELPHFTLSDAESQRLDARTPAQELQDVLEGLWDAVVKPILDELGFAKPVTQPGDDWPRIWWIPTGALSKFPIHAAGYHDHFSGETVLDRVMSSYSPSIRALTEGRRRQLGNRVSKSPQHQQHEQVLLVAMEETEDQTPLKICPR